MDFIGLAKQRFSSRKYKNLKVEESKLNLVLEAGRIAPSAANTQPWIFVVVRDENVNDLRTCYHGDWFKTAPMYIVLCANHLQSWKRRDGKDHSDIDIAIATDHMTLAATNIGLATCWICNFDKQKLVKVLNLPDHFEPTVMLTLGYADDLVNAQRHDLKRKKLDEIVYYEKYS